MLLILATACKEVPKDHRLPYYNTPDFTPLFLDHQEEAELLVPHQIGHFTMMDQHGDTITDTILHGKIHVANFIFTSCMSICPVMTDHMKSVSQAFGDREEVAILSFSVTPWIDTVGRLKAYAVKNNIQSKTGTCSLVIKVKSTPWPVNLILLKKTWVLPGTALIFAYRTCTARRRSSAHPRYL